jgi:hypothetical protein
MGEMRERVLSLHASRRIESIAVLPIENLSTKLTAKSPNRLATSDLAAVRHAVQGDG